MLDNHWSHGLKDFKWSAGELPLGTYGARLELGTKDLPAGPEVIAAFLQATDFANNMKRCFPFQVGTNLGIAPTDAGRALCCLLDSSSG